MIPSGFSTSFQTNTAVPELWWSKLFDLRHKKFLPMDYVYIRLDCADPVP